MPTGRRGATVDLRESPQGGHRINGWGGYAVGHAVAATGDQNGDGLSDLLIGEIGSCGASHAFVVFGRAIPPMSASRSSARSGRSCTTRRAATTLDGVSPARGTSRATAGPTCWSVRPRPTRMA